MQRLSKVRSMESSSIRTISSMAEAGLAAVWLAWLGAFAVIEGYALVSRAQGDTLSERLRAWFRVKRPAGSSSSGRYS